MRIEISTKGFNENNFEEKIKIFDKIVKEAKYEFGIHIGFEVSREFAEKIKQTFPDLKYSMHAPLFDRYYLNLTNKNFSGIKKRVKNQLELAKEFNIDFAVFHGWLLNDGDVKLL